MLKTNDKIVLAICLVMIVFPFILDAQPPQLDGIASQINQQKSGAKNIMNAVCGVAGIISAIWVIIAYFNNNPNLKAALYSFFGAIIFWGVINLIPW